jgi:hypothetical protein
MVESRSRKIALPPNIFPILRVRKLAWIRARESSDAESGIRSRYMDAGIPGEPVTPRRRAYA